MRTADLEPFTSLVALRRAHEELFEYLPKLSPAEGTKKVDDFIYHAIASGTVLDTLADRREAQGLIDYWVASSYNRPRYQVGPEAPLDADQQTPPEAPRRPARSDNQLKTFDKKVVTQAAASGDGFIEGLASEKEKKLARQLLFRLVQLPDAGDEFISAPARREELHRFGDAARVDELLKGLKTAGVIEIEPGETPAADIVVLRYMALAREWEWLKDEIAKRMNLRHLALSWVGSGRSDGALLDWRLTRGFREYSNLNQWETDLINRSSTLSIRRFLWAGLGAILMAVGLLSSKQVFLENYYAPAKVDSVNRQIKTRSTPTATKIENIKWLSRYRQNIDAAGLDFGGAETKDLSELDAPGAVFRDARLKAVDFKGAGLERASFSGSVIEDTTFQDASLARARFDSVDLCEKVDFTDADLLHTSFKRARFDDQSIPIFARTAWWQGDGWGFDEIAELGRRYPKEGVKDGAKFKKERARVESRVQQDKDGPLGASALNEKAWTLAIYGDVADGAAEKAAKDGLALATDQFLKASLGDTLAYILMQKPETDLEKQAKNLDDAATALANSTTVMPNEGEVQFRYAVALHALNRDADARSRLVTALLEQQYEPSHELYLLNQHITGDFKQWIMDMTGRTTRRFPARCPLNRPSR